MATTLTDYSNLQIGNGLDIEKYDLNSDTVLNIFGNGVTNYSSYLFENFIYLLSNFSGQYPPGSNFASFYQNNTSWIYSGETLENNKTLLPGQFWYQYPTLPVMSETVYSIVEQLNSDISDTQKTDLENQLIAIFKNSTTFQNSGNLYVLNSPSSQTVAPLTYNLPNYGIISVFDVSELGWKKITIENNGGDYTTLSLTTNGTNENSSINFYTSTNGTTLTSSIIANSGTDNNNYSGNLSFNTGNYNVTSTNVNFSAISNINIAANNIVLNGKNVTLSNVLSQNDNSQNIATTLFVNNAISSNALSIKGGTLEGELNVIDPTNDYSKQAANTEYVNNRINTVLKNGILAVTNYINGNSNDITAAISTAITNGLNYIYIPDGNYTISSNITLSNKNFTVFGNGLDSIITQTFDGDLFTVKTSNIEFKNFSVQSSVSRTSGYVINSSGNNNIIIDSIFMNSDNKNNFSAFNIDTCNNVVIKNCNILQNAGYGIKLSNITFGTIESNTILDCGSYSPGAFDGINISGTNLNLKITNNFSGNSTSSSKYQNYGINLNSGTNISLTNNIFCYNINGINVPSSITNIGNIVN